MKIIPITLLFLSITVALLAQTDSKTDPRFQKFLDKIAASKGVTANVEPKASSNHFYKTYNDFLAGKPAPDILLKGPRTSNAFGSNVSYEVTKNDKSNKINVKDLAAEYWGFCDRFGNLFRLYENDSYQVFMVGKICQYVKAGECYGTLKPDSTFALQYGNDYLGPNALYSDYASTGVNGEIINLDASLNGKSKELEKLMSSHPEIYKALLADESKDKYVGVKYMKRENLTFKIQHYIKEYNKL